MSLLDIHDDFNIRIKTLNNMGFTLQYWGRPDWFGVYKSNSIYYTKGTRKCHWKPCKKFYEYYDEDNRVVIMYFPKGFDAHIHWDALGLSGKNIDFSKSSYVVAYDDSDDPRYGRFRAIATPVKTVIDIECVIMQVNKLIASYQENDNI